MNRLKLRTYALAMAVGSLLTTTVVGQEAEDEVYELSPFEVTSEQTEGYSAVDTLAGNRLNTKIRDVGAAVTVITPQLLKDIGATDNKTLLQYTTGTEVGGPEGNFGGFGDGSLLNEAANFRTPNQNTRVRGLTSADNTRDFFTSDIPWDGYNVERVELQRGPNSILFGQGSPAGLVNVGLKSASFENSNNIEVRFDEHESTRYVVDVNRELVEGQLAFRFSALYDDEKYQQEPAFSRDERIYAALRWDPNFANGDRTRTTFKANFEDGKIRSNNPRTLPPIDRITPWFESGTYNGVYISDGNIVGPDGELIAVSKGDTRVYSHLNRATFNAHQVQQDNLFRANHGQNRPGINGGPYSGTFNPDYLPNVGSFAENFGGPLNFYGVDGGTPDIWQQEIKEYRGIGPDGEVDGGIGAFNFNRAIGIAPQASFARNAGLPFGEFGVYKNNNLTDPSIFNFFDNLIDGPNKNEWQNFQNFTTSFSQTFLGDMIGYDISYNEQTYDNGQLSLLSGSLQALSIDMMGVFSDGTNDGALDGGVPFDDGTPNPNVGRPFVSDKGQFQNNWRDIERDSIRFTPFARYDLERGDGNWFTRLLGSGTFTGLYSEDTFDRDRRDFQQYAILDESYIDFIDNPANPSIVQFTDNNLSPSTIIYLGDSLINSSTAVGANIPRVQNVAMLPRNANVRIFDSNWANLPGVDPAAEWLNNVFLPPELEYPDYDPTNPDAATLWPDRRISTQSENAANYVGWRDVPYVLTGSEDAPGNRDLLARNAALDKRVTESEALIWQGHLWDDSIVGTYGWRRDTVTSNAFSQNTGDHQANFGHLNFDPSYYSYNNENSTSASLEVQSRSYSIVAHLDNNPLLRGMFDNSPVRVSLFYNNSTNFQPESARVDAYGESLSAPSGETTDRGIRFESRDGRYAFKVNKYKSTVTNASSGALSGAWFIGASQAWSGDWVNRFQYDFASSGPEIATNMANNRPAGAPNPPGFDLSRIPASNPDFDETNSLYNYGTAPGETLADAQVREQAAIAAWRSWQSQVDPRFYEAWGLDLNAPFAANPAELSSITSTPQNFAVTENSVSEGYEFEFTMQPVENWDILINASKSKASRNNIGGTALSEFISGYQDALRNTAAGDLRIWWGGAGNETALFQWNNNIGSEWTSRKLQEGTDVPELREWRWNAITNYSFSEGKLKGVNVGAGLRWQDSVVIGYIPIPGANEGEVSFDLANPYMGPSETNFDFWVGYGRRLKDRVDWRIQLNVRNAFQDDDLVPITVQPDGSPAGFRIAPSQTWAIRNTFSF